MAQADKDSDDAGKTREVHAVEPTHRIGPELQVTGVRDGRERGVAHQDGVNAPANQDDDHDGRNLHDAHGFLAGFVDALDVVPPEVNGADNRKAGSAKIGRDVKSNVDVVGGFVEQAGDVLAGGHAADGAGQNVVEHQGRNTELCNGPA